MKKEKNAEVFSCAQIFYFNLFLKEHNHNHLSTQRDFFFQIDVRFSDLSRVKSRSAVLTEAAAPMEHGTRCRR